MSRARPAGADEIEAIPADAALPHLRRALDAGWMRDAFERGLKPASGATAEIVHCALDRFRHRPGSR